MHLKGIGPPILALALLGASASAPATAALAQYDEPGWVQKGWWDSNGIRIGREYLGEDDNLERVEYVENESMRSMRSYLLTLVVFKRPDERELNFNGDRFLRTRSAGVDRYRVMHENTLKFEYDYREGKGVTRICFRAPKRYSDCLQARGNGVLR